MALKAGIVQTTTGIDAAANSRALVAAIGRLADRGATLLFTPEMSGLLDRDTSRLGAHVQQEGADPTLAAVRAVARVRGVTVALGSLAIRRPDGRLANRSFLIGADGAIIARYDKMHLFDVALPGGERYRESGSFAAGDHIALADLPWGRLGLSICYDVRFPALYGALARAGAAVIAVPAAFTVPTGQAHWHVLVRARAIETGAFVVAAAQTGQHEDGRRTFGHSLVVDPWGRVQVDMGEAPGEALADLDLALVSDARARIPALAHARALA